MKSKFYGYYMPSKETFDSLWDNALIVLDANILLDFYRLSKSTCDDLFEVLKTLEDRIWIPYQAAYEYHRNIVNVVKSQIKQNDDALQALSSFKKFFDNKRSYPFLTESLNKRTAKLTEELETFLQEQKDDLLKIIFEKSVKDDICDFFEGKVGDGFSDEQLKAYYREAEDRYKSNIPPGFKDSEKNGDNKFGDYIIWREIISKASNDNKDILFITDDVKCDWYIEIVKTRLYNMEDKSRKTAQYVLNKVLSDSLKLLHPFMPFVTEKIYKELYNNDESIMIAKYPEYNL